MRGEMGSTKLPGADPTALVTAGKRIPITKIVRRPGDIQGGTDPRATTTISRTSTEITLESEGVLPETEVISQGQNTDKDQETNTDHMAQSATIGMLLHTEVETGESPPHTTQVEGIKVPATTGLQDTEESRAALDQDTAMMAEITDRALGLKGGCP